MPIENLCYFLDFCKPKKVKNTKILVVFINRKDYKKTISKLRLIDFYRVLKYAPFMGITEHYYTKTKEYLPIIYITIRKNNDKYRCAITKKHVKNTGYLPMTLNGTIEDFISILSHELYHVVYEKAGKNLREPIEETMCDRYAIKKLKEWRRRKK